MFLITASSGPLKGATWALDETDLVVGRSPETDIRIDDREVSRRHCVLRATDSGVVVQDLGSSNKTLVNGRVASQTAVKSGDTISVGPVTFILSTSNDGRLAQGPKKDEHSSTLSLSDSVLLGERRREPDMDRLSAPQTVSDLLCLFAVGRRLGQAGTVTALSDVLREALEERFGVCHFWVGRVRGAKQPLHLCIRPEDAPGRSPDEVLARCMRESRALCDPTSGGPMLAAPLLANRATVGAIAVHLLGTGTAPDQEALEFLLALGAQLAPYLVSIEQTEKMRSDLDRLRAASGEGTHLVGSNRAILHVRQLIEEAAQSELSVLILGETGTGKELAARLVHECSPRAAGPFIALNCAAIPGELFESELFGHEKGAFTGAVASKQGCIELAHGGTLFLDEVGDLSPPNQARLLRAIETGTFRRLGAQAETQVDIRVVSATNQELARAVSERAFRADLLHRLNGFEIEMPPLREHLSDIPELAEHFLRAARSRAKHPIAGLSEEALTHLRRHAWPGNVRELRMCIERAVARSRESIIGPADLLLSTSPEAVTLGVGEPLTLAEVEKRHIRAVLAESEGNMSAAARILQINRGTLYKKVRDYGL
ncbi:MAG: sigma 54-dependent Fis family transcriptional regulator [bacterium]|nr:sigma 54-dependent Fis family transcriptional regulator [bacterium]